MRKLWAAAAAAAVVVGVGGAADAAPKEPSAWICNGFYTEITISGRNGVIPEGINGGQYHAVYFAVTDPATGQIYTKTWGGGRDIFASNALTCYPLDGSNAVVIAVPVK